MDIIIGRIQSAKEEGSRKNPFKKDGEKSFLKERRKNKQDRRQSIRDGVIVTLSTKKDRRTLPDRRNGSLEKDTYTI